MIIEREDGTFEGVPEGCTVRRATWSEPIYGGFHGGDPRDFIPDEECCTAEEMEAWRAACARWDAAKGPENSGPDPEDVPTELGKMGAFERLDDGRVVKWPCFPGAFGLGTSTVEVEGLELVHPDGRVERLY